MAYVSKKNKWKNLLREAIRANGLVVNEEILDNIDCPTYDFVNLKTEYKTKLIEHHMKSYKAQLLSVRKPPTNV